MIQKMSMHVQVHSEVDPEIRDRQLALEHIATIWGLAENEGIDPEAMSHAAIFAAMATLVNEFGEEATAELIGRLPDRIRSGEFSLNFSRQ